jgi:hypothetical protein
MSEDEIKDAPAYTEMPNAFLPEKEEAAAFEGTNEQDVLADAAVELDERRKRDAQDESPITDRTYVTIGGDDHGKPRPPNETVDLLRASEDLTRERDAEVHAKHQELDEAVAYVADANLQQQQPQQQPQAEQQLSPEAQQQQQAQNEQAEFERALNNPKLRAALEQEVGKLEQSRSQYASAASAAFELSAAAVYSQFSELNGATFQTLPAIINAVNQNNPQRAQAMVRALQSTEQLHQASRQAQAAQAEIAQAKQAMWFKSENDRFDAAIASEPKAVVEEVMREGRRVLQESYGITPEGLGQMLKQNPGLRSAESQRLIFDSIRSKLNAEKLAAKRVPANIPNVQRPGVSQPRPNYSEEYTENARRAFLKEPTPESGARFLQARRDAKGR